MPDPRARSLPLRLPLIGLVAGLLLIALGLTAGPAHAAKLSPGDLKIATTPELFPAFDPSIGRYVTRCEGEQTQVQIVAPHGTKVRVDDSRRRSGRFDVGVPLHPGAASNACSGDAHG